MWVHATLVRTSLEVYQRYVGKLTIDEQRAVMRVGGNDPARYQIEF